MTDLLIRNLDPELAATLERRARAHARDVSEEARELLSQGLGLNPLGVARGGPPPGLGMGTWLQSLLPPEYRGDDLVFEAPGPVRPPPDFE